MEVRAVRSAYKQTTRLANLYASALVARWPMERVVSPTRWLALARVAVRWWWGPQLEELADSALEAKLLTATCVQADLDKAHTVAHELLEANRCAPARNARLAALTTRSCN